MPDHDDDDDAAFAALPLALKRRIDHAFDSAFPITAASKRPLGPHPSLGFILDSTPAPGGFLPDEPIQGGFLRDATPSAETPPSHIPLSFIPTALQSLDLQPDDEDVLSIFRNAASGWTDNASATHDALVSRKDWHAVCAALLDATTPDHGEDIDMGGSNHDADANLKSALSDSGEEYVLSEHGESNSDDDGDDDYEQGASTRARKMGKPKASPNGRPERGHKPSLDPSSAKESNRRPHSSTPRQHKECRAAFALFFPDVANQELDRQRIAIRDITRVAKLLKENISAEETMEMLETFSSMPDKSMTLGDFERMMIAAKMA